MQNAIINAYVKFFENLSPSNLDRLDAITSHDLYFEDPFNQLHGRDAVKKSLRAMFDKVDNPKFQITDRAYGQQGAYLKWYFTFNWKNKNSSHRIIGMSEIHLNSANLICRHIDHWDASTQFYAHLPLLGWLIKLARRELQD